MNEELKADWIILGNAAITTFEYSFAKFMADVKLKQAEEELQALRVVFFCKYGKFPDEV